MQIKMKNVLPCSFDSLVQLIDCWFQQTHQTFCQSISSGILAEILGFIVQRSIVACSIHVHPLQQQFRDSQLGLVRKTNPT